MSDDIKIGFSHSLDGSLAFQFAVKAYSDFYSEGINALRLKGDNKVIYAMNGSQYVGVIIFERITVGEGQNLNIIKSYVDPEHRGVGIWEIMWKELVEMAKLWNVSKITGRVSSKNTKMQAKCEAVGRKAVSINYEFEVLKDKSV